MKKMKFNKIALIIWIIGLAICLIFYLKPEDMRIVSTFVSTFLAVVMITYLGCGLFMLTVFDILIFPFNLC